MVWAGGEEMAPSPPENPRWSTPMPQPNDLSRCLTALDQDSTLIAIIEMSQASWLVGAIVPGIERHPLKKLAPDAEELLQVLQRWGRAVKRITVAFEAGRDGFWLARWLRAHGIEAHVIHASSVAVSREHRRAKTDRLDVDLLKRAFLGCERRYEGRLGDEHKTRLRRSVIEYRPLLTNRGGGEPASDMALVPRSRMDPPPRSFAADAHDCIMVPIPSDRPNTSLWRDLRASGGLPSVIMPKSRPSRSKFA
jgi:hypothetical protein